MVGNEYAAVPWALTRVVIRHEVDVERIDSIRVGEHPDKVVLCHRRTTA